MPRWPLLGLPSCCLIFKSCHSNSFEDRIPADYYFQISCRDLINYIAGYQDSSPPMTTMPQTFPTFIPQEMWLRNKSREERWLLSEDVDSGRLPRWFGWLAWLLVFGAIGASGFFVILYSLDWGGDKANRWLGSFVLSFVEILCLMDPFVVSD